MQNLIKVKDGYVQYSDPARPKDVRFIRLESPDADVRMTVAFHKSGPPCVSVFAAPCPNGYWDPVGAPQFYVEEDEDGAAWKPPMNRNLELMNAAIARIRAGDQFLDDDGKEG